MRRLVPFVSLLCVLLILPVAGAATEERLVLFDQSHGQRFRIEERGELQLSGLADLIRSRGARVAAVADKLNEQTLRGASGLVISGPFEALDPAEVAAVLRFVEQGGQLAIMLHVAPPLSPLLHALGLDHSNGVLHERSNQLDSDLNFRVTDLAATPPFQGVSHFSVYGAWALEPGHSSSAARTSAEAWVDLNGDGRLSKGDAVGRFSVAVAGNRGAGRFVVFGDDALFQNRFLDEHNARLAGNLAGWLLAH